MPIWGAYPIVETIGPGSKSWAEAVAGVEKLFELLVMYVPNPFVAPKPDKEFLGEICGAKVERFIPCIW